MEIEDKNLKVYLQKVDTNKHDITMRLKKVVLSPICFIKRKKGVSSVFTQEVGSLADQVYKQANDIMACFAEKWHNNDDSFDDQILSIIAKMRYVNESTIPAIKQLIDTYSDWYSKKYYFDESEDGEELAKRLKQSIDNNESVCRDLARLNEHNTNEPKSIKQSNLLELLQEVIDDIQAEVTYLHEYEASLIIVNIDPDIFINHVLANIRENINSHAFGTREFKSKLVCDKHVEVEINENSTEYVISISNDGEQFTGDYSKVFEYGYCHGAKKHSGIGMYSIKEAMQKLGGDVWFDKSESQQYSVTYKLKIAK
jgi:hypothetical protein